MHSSDETGGRIRVLVVDRGNAEREAIARILWNQGYEVIAAETGEDALVLLHSATPEVMLCDVTLSDMSGLELLEALPGTLGSAVNVAVVMVTGTADAHTAAACLQRGAVDYLTRPFSMEELRDAVLRALKVRAASVPEPQAHRVPGGREGRGEEAATDAFSRRERVVVPTLDALVAALEAKNAYLAGHSARIAAFAATIAHQLSLADDQVEQVRTAGRLHDLGMIGVRDQVIDKRGKLTPDEYAHVRQHVRIGVRILAPLTYLGAPILDAVRTHHERWDGAGYPDGLTGEAIPLGGRILGACEVFDALTTRRPYRDQVEPEVAIGRMRDLSGKVVDPSVMDALANAVQHRQTLTFLR